MNAIVSFITGTLNTVAWLYIFLPCTIIFGLYLTIRNRGLQFTKFGYVMKNTLGKMFQKQEAGEGAVTPMQAVSTALAATVGTGNIVGTSQAIALGGYGAIFWLWLAALLGMMVKYSEVLLAIKYRERDAKGDWVGGPMYYVKNGLGKGWQWVAILFCIFASLAAFGIGNMSQVNSIVGSINNAVDAFIPSAAAERGMLNLILGIVLAVLVGIILFSPVMLVVATLIKLTSPGPIIFKQERVGLHNKPFMMYKFRSMVQQTEADEKKGWTVPGDPRVTRVGRFIRKTSIDEFPQFFNVLAGQMSLIGPRPERTQFVEMFKEEIPRYMIKHQVRPGMTGWAQVNGLRGDTSIYERVKYDIWYIENWTMSLDVKILFLTIFKGFVNKNAY